jgi:hypothetical protein
MRSKTPCLHACESSPSRACTLPLHPADALPWDVAGRGGGGGMGASFDAAAGNRGGARQGGCARASLATGRVQPPASTTARAPANSSQMPGVEIPPPDATPPDPSSGSNRGAGTPLLWPATSAAMAAAASARGARQQDPPPPAGQLLPLQAAAVASMLTPRRQLAAHVTQPTYDLPEDSPIKAIGEVAGEGSSSCVYIYGGRRVMHAAQRGDCVIMSLLLAGVWMRP